MELRQDHTAASTFRIQFTLSEYIDLSRLAKRLDQTSAETLSDAIETALDVIINPPKKLPPTASLNT